MNIRELKNKALENIEANKDKIIEIGEKIYNNPELGYKENFATDLVFDEMDKLGLNPEKNLAVTGCNGILDTGKKGPQIAVMGELDAVICREHPDADPKTGAVHACGHNIQTAAMLGVAFGLNDQSVLDQLAGQIEFMAVPAEEYVEIEYRLDLKENGEISYLGGKQEMIKRGHFDDIDISMMIHSMDLQDKKVLISPSGNGFVGKKVQFTGKEAHAGGAPDQGINALNAAMLAINNINALRETFKDEDRIRVHPIITKGGDIVNIVPADVRMESYVRGRTIDALMEANKKVNNALRAGGMAIGADVDINDIPGYMPLLNDENLDDILHENTDGLVTEEEIVRGVSFTGSFDFGDITHIMPGLHPFIGGVEGDIHTRNFRMKDPETAYILSAKLMALTLIDLLVDDAARANKVINQYEPKLTKEEYLELLADI
ncbi:amidohydrolase [Halanaerobiaceae bacterium Z-7014]|uniref:Peptidase M20 domain-containing protein 2 n=1 Tax=Halonatronomonas betaini TaxID=2778430 RepID=A0A931AR82_9FIRM|nr:amidohydrolase [Halonatronomonas betaini]MBF8437482.1 amidohydrolase [Halonatronomonas betaini]